MTDEEFRELFARSEANTRELMLGLRTDLLGEMGALRTELRGEMDTRFEDMKRYIGIEREATRSEIKLISEAVDIFGERFVGDIAEIRGEMTRGFKDTRDLIFFLVKEMRRPRKRIARHK